MVFFLILIFSLCLPVYAAQYLFPEDIPFASGDIQNLEVSPEGLSLKSRQFTSNFTSGNLINIDSSTFSNWIIPARNFSFGETPALGNAEGKEPQPTQNTTTNGRILAQKFSTDNSFYLGRIGLYIKKCSGYSTRQDLIIHLCKDKGDGTPDLDNPLSTLTIQSDKIKSQYQWLDIDLPLYLKAGKFPDIEWICLEGSKNSSDWVYCYYEWVWKGENQLSNGKAGYKERNGNWQFPMDKDFCFSTYKWVGWKEGKYISEVIDAGENVLVGKLESKESSLSQNNQEPNIKENANYCKFFIGTSSYPVINDFYPVSANEKFTFPLKRYFQYKVELSSSDWTTAALREVKLDFSYYLNGEYISKAIDFGNVVLWDKFEVEQDIPAEGSNINYSIQVSSNNSQWTPWTEINPPSKIELPPQRYLRWKAMFSSDNPEITPKLKNLKINYTYNHQPIVEIISPVAEKIPDNLNYLDFQWEFNDLDEEQQEEFLIEITTIVNDFSSLIKTLQPSPPFSNKSYIYNWDAPLGVYWWRIKAKDESQEFNNWSKWSNVASFEIVLAPPEEFCGEFIDSDKIIWEWEDISKSEDGYRVYNEDGEIISGNLDANTTFWREINISTGTVYERYVRAFKEDKESVSSNPFKLESGTLEIFLEGKPESESSISWEWETQGLVIGEKKYFFCDEDGNKISDLSSSTIYFVERNLAENKIYKRMIKVEVGDSEFSSSPEEACTLVSPVKQILFPEITSSSILLSWNEKENVKYEVWRADSSGNFKKIAQTNNDIFLDEGLISKNKYQYKIYSLNQFGEINPISSPSFFVETTCISPPLKIENLNLELVTENKIHLTWERPADPCICGYKIFRKESENNFECLATLSPSTLEFFDLHLPIDTSPTIFYYKIISFNIKGEESQPTIIDSGSLYKEIFFDLDNDGNDEIIRDSDFSIKGFDLLISSTCKIIVLDDLNLNGNVEFLIDINNDNVADKYFCPQQRILTSLNLVDVDGDGYQEYVYDVDGDQIPDYFYKNNKVNTFASFKGKFLNLDVPSFDEIKIEIKKGEQTLFFGPLDGEEFNFVFYNLEKSPYYLYIQSPNYLPFEKEIFPAHNQNDYYEINLIPFNLSNQQLDIHNFPNPFKEKTNFVYYLPKMQKVEIRIYNRLGEIVNILDKGFQDSGNYQFEWIPQNQAGNELAPGVYFYILKTEENEKKNKMVILP